MVPLEKKNGSFTNSKILYTFTVFPVQGIQNCDAKILAKVVVLFVCSLVFWRGGEGLFIFKLSLPYVHNGPFVSSICVSWYQKELLSYSYSKFGPRPYFLRAFHKSKTHFQGLRKSAYSNYTRMRTYSNGCRHKKWNRWFEFKSCTRLFAFHFALMHLGKEWIYLFNQAMG